MIQQQVIDINYCPSSFTLSSDCFWYMRLQIAKLGMSKNIRTRDGARHFVTKKKKKASDVTPPTLRKKLCGSRRFEKMVKKSLGGALAPPWRRPCGTAFAPSRSNCKKTRIRMKHCNAGLLLVFYPSVRIRISILITNQSNRFIVFFLCKNAKAYFHQ